MIDRGEAIRRLALNAVRFSGIARAARPILGGVGAILMLHRVTDAPPTPLGVNAHLAVTPAFLDAAIAEMKRLGYLFVSMDAAVERVATARSGERFAAITLDDAYLDNATEALPVFERHETPFTIYVAPGLTSGEADLWWDVLEEIVTRRDAVTIEKADGRTVVDTSTPARKKDGFRRIADYLTEEVGELEQRGIVRALARAAGLDPREPGRRTLMDWDQIRGIAAHPLATIGAHTVNHYALKRLPEDVARREIEDAAGILSIELGRRPDHMAYPYGYAAAVGPRETRLAREAGFASAVTTRHGLLQREHAGHCHALPRISVNGRYQRIAHLRTMLSGVTTPLANSGRRVVTV